MALEIRVLGRVDALVDGRSLPLRRSKQRGVLAMLALRANRTVSAEELIDGLWAEHPPASAAKNLQFYVSQLRKALAADDCGASIVTHGGGYELQVPQDAVDAVRFEHLVEEAAREPASAGANGTASAALELWHGAPLADVASEPFAPAEIRRLEELHLRALELAFDAELAAGHHDEVIARLEALIAQEPLRERLHAQRMLALYRAGRQSEALDAYREAHRTLAEQIGVAPGPELRRLQEQILAQDPALDAPAPIVELPRELEGGSPLLAGRERELRWLRRRWGQASEGRVVIALVCGPAGIGKTRLVAELANEVQSTGVAVLFAGGGEVADAALATVADAGKGQRSTLLVLDYADDAPPAVLEAAAALAREPEGRALLICVLHHDEQGPPAYTALLESGGAQCLRLGPLGEDATAEIATLYAPSEGAAMPLRTLLAESDGVPLRIHRAANEWARAEAAERLAATAGHATSERPGLRTTEAELAGSVVDLQVAREQKAFYEADEPVDPSAPEVCPFRGLAPFDAAHAEYFFGRERLVAELVARLVGSTLLAVVGPSGSGKSSAVRAGLLPALADGVVPGSERWRRALMRPGERPLAELSRALARAVPEAGGEDPAPWIADALDQLEPGERLVLLIDQFEEAFVGCRDPDERAAFVAALVEGAADPDQRLIVVLAIRADFYGRCAEHAELSTLVSANQVLVGPMRRDELRRAIELPARKVGLRVARRLVSAMVGDVASEPGGLPLLSAALVELWQRRDRRTLTYRAYERTGGVEGAVGRLAEDAYQRLSEAERRRARPLLLRLADAEESAESLVRRRVSIDELELERDPDAARALAVLTESRLLTVDEGAVEVAHEALLREWPRLRGWLADDAEGRRLHQHLTTASREWRDADRDPAELYRGARLAAALDWAAEHDPELNELERSFLDESRMASEREAERQRRTNRRLRTLFAGVGVLLAAALVAGVVALSEREGARDAATAETAQRLGAQALTEDRLDRALMLANAGVALDDSLATRSSLLSTLLRSPAAVGVLDGDAGASQALALSPEGNTLAVGDGQGRLTLFDTETRQQVGDHQLPGEPWSLAFDPRGDSLAIPTSGSLEHPNASLQIVDATTLRVRSVSLGPHPAASGSRCYYPTAVYDPDGRSLVVSYSTGDCGYSVPVFLRRFDARTGSPLGPAVRVAPKSSKIPLISTAHGRLLVSTATGGAGDGRTYSIDAETLRVLDRYPVSASSTAVSPDGRTLAFEPAAGGGVRLLDLASGRVRTLVHPGGDFAVGAFSPDGRTLSTWEEDGNTSLWDLDTGALTQTFELASGSQVFSPDGRTLYTAGADPTAMIWDVDGDRRLLRPFRTDTDTYPFQPWPPSFATSPDGRTLAIGGEDGRVNLIDGETLRRTGGFVAFPGRSPAIEYSPDGRRLAVAGRDGGLGLWDARSGNRVGPLISTPRGAGPRSARALAFGPGGMLAAATQAAVGIWDLEGPKLIRPPLRLGHRVLGLAFGPDGSQLAIATSSGVEVRDLPGGERLASLPTPEAPLARDEVSLAFSPDGRLLAGGQQDGDVILWATGGWGQVGQLPAAGALGLVFSPDGHMLATSGGGAVLLWDVGSQQPIGSPLPLQTAGDSYVTTRFTPDGDRLFAVSDEGRAIRFEVDLQAWVQHACDVAGDLAPEEWEEVLPEQDFVSACSSD